MITIESYKSENLASNGMSSQSCQARLAQIDPTIGPLLLYLCRIFEVNLRYAIPLST